MRLNLFPFDQMIEETLEGPLDPETGERLPGALDYSTGEIRESAAKAVADLELAKDEHLLDFGCYLRDLKISVDAKKAHEKMVHLRRKAEEQLLELGKLALAKKIGQGNKVEDERIRLGTRKNTKVLVDDFDEVDFAFKRFFEPVDPEIDKNAVKAAWRDGHEVSGCRKDIELGLTIK